MRNLLSLLAAFVLVATALAVPASADVNGLNNVPTATLVPVGTVVGNVFFDTTKTNHVNANSALLQLGVTKYAEVAYSRGLTSKPTDAYSAEVGGITAGPLTLSAGILNQNFRKAFNPTYFAVGDVDLGNVATLSFGAEYLRSTKNTEGFIGAKIPVPHSDVLNVVTDYTSGKGGEATAGLAWNVTDRLTVEPVVVWANAPHSGTTSYAEFTFSL